MLTVPEAALSLNVSTRTVYRMVATGELPAVRVRGRSSLLIAEDAVENAKIPTPVRVTHGPEAMPERACLTPAEVAGVLNCSTETVRRMIREGALHAVRGTGGRSHYRIPADSFRAFLDHTGAAALAG